MPGHDGELHGYVLRLARATTADEVLAVASFIPRATESLDWIQAQAWCSQETWAKVHALAVVRPAAQR